MKWFTKKVRGWTVPFWYSDTPLYSKRFAKLSEANKYKLVEQIRKQRFK